MLPSKPKFNPEMEPLLRLYLIRHGETDYNQRRMIQGHTEVPINQTGIDQATRLARRMSGVPLDIIYSSDVRRAAMTAAILSSHTGVRVAYEPLWRERNPGELIHKPYEECMEFFTSADFHPPGGESLGTFEDRVRSAATRLLEQEASTAAQRHVAVVSHGMVCAAFLRTHFSDPAFQQPVLRWRNTSLTIADYYDGEWRLITLSDASHLDEEVPSATEATAVGA